MKLLALAILGLPFGMPFPRGGAEYIIWGKVMASLESGSWWVLWIWGRPWLVLTPKVLQLCANQLVCWFYAGLFEWVSCLTLVLVPSRSSNTPLCPSKVLRAGNVLGDLNLSNVSILRLNLNLPRGLGARHLFIFIQHVLRKYQWNMWNENRPFCVHIQFFCSI